jgi:hypothetical protein
MLNVVYRNDQRKFGGNKVAKKETKGNIPLDKHPMLQLR